MATSPSLRSQATRREHATQWCIRLVRKIALDYDEFIRTDAAAVSSMPETIANPIASPPR